ncbi:CUB and sushi domain-containing protein 3-like [Amphiura filiformis]|uniref:CUB and sushi domain-containing protein 3-like n=1 Tax=Amphiura filiformis TaxID=82378 RepID=UPI003B216B8F
MATDSVSGSIDATFVSINSSPREFRPNYYNEGQYTLGYEAEDEAGNKATYDLILVVKVPRCPMPIVAPNMQFWCGDNVNYRSNIAGITCNARCGPGHCLIGSSTLDCINIGTLEEPQGQWSNTIPTCEPIRCPDFVAPINGYLVAGSCPTTNGSRCDVACNPGYQLQQTSQNIECLVDDDATCGEGYWSRETVCEDKEPPIFSSPASIVFIAEPKETRAFVDYSWEPIQAFDTASGVIQANLISIDSEAVVNGERPSIFTEGIHTLEYEAVDEHGNRAVMILQLIGSVIRCPSPIDSTSNGEFFCDTSDYILGTTCILVCNNGYCYEGVYTMTCLPKIGSSELGQWSNTDLTCNQPQCPNLIPPSNGHVLSGAESCSGSECEMACDATYETIGDAVRHCNIHPGAACSDAFWSGQQLQCRATTCPAIEDNSPAFSSGCQSDTAVPIGTICQWYCPSGYQGAGSSISTCLLGGTWDNTDFTCEEILCPPVSMTPGSEFTPASCGLQPSTTGTVCDQSCTTPGFWLGDTTGSTFPNDYVICTGTGDWLSIFGLDLNEVECIDIESPRFTDCLPTKTIYAEKYFEVAYLSMNAVDNSGLSPEVTCDQDGLVPAGVYSVSCTATDDANNQATCASLVTVTVRRCQPLILPNHGVLDSNETCANHYGGECGITCEDGYVLHGSSRAMCEYDQSQTYWAWTEQPSCQVAATPCSLLEAQLPSDISLQCSASNNIGSACTLLCTRDGYVLTGITEQIVCGSDGSWNMDVLTLNLSCQDIEPPTIDSCPSRPIHGELTNTSPPLAEIYFDTPQASDNSQAPLRVEITPQDVTSPYFVQTDTLITYQFYDEAGNSAICSFQVTVINNLPPAIQQCPVALNFDSTNDVTWDVPLFTNPVTEAPIVPVCDRQPGDAFLSGDHTITCTAINPDNGATNICAFVITVAGCQDLPPPVNGIWSCSENACQLVCNNGYGVRHGLPKTFTCGDSGWQPPASLVPECKQIGPPIIIQTSDAFFGTDVDCNNDDVKQGIESDFRGFVERSAVGSPCSGVCDVLDAQVSCETTSSRRRRSNNFVMSLCYTLVSNLEAGTSMAASNAKRAALEALSRKMAKKITDNDFHPSNNVTMQPMSGDNGTGVEVESVLVDCLDDGCVLVEGELSCVPCEVNTYESDGECLACPAGAEQPEEGQTSCIDMMETEK